MMDQSEDEVAHVTFYPLTFDLMATDKIFDDVVMELSILVSHELSRVSYIDGWIDGVKLHNFSLDHVSYLLYSNWRG